MLHKVLPEFLQHTAAFTVLYSGINVTSLWPDERVTVRQSGSVWRIRTSASFSKRKYGLSIDTDLDDLKWPLTA